ncbi:MAG: DUF4252 domain-containing protein [Bacteroidales bacterium]|nr:DUF4252 domain-containing protein [Bacteroidales bacterium]
MKKLYAILILLAVSVSAIAQDGRSLYAKYSDLPGVEAVYISSAMFRLIGKIPDVELGGEDVNLAPIIKSLKGFYILSTEDPAIGKDLYADVTKRLDRGEYELLMEAKEDGQVMRLYTAGDDFTVRSFIMLTRDGTETSFIGLDGDMPREQLEDIVLKAVEE